MLGPFDGALTNEGGRTRESLAPAFAAALVAAGGDGALAEGRAATVGDGAAALVRFRFDAEGLTYDADLTGARPWAAVALAQRAALESLARVARALAEMHASGESHGDVRPGLVWVDASANVVLLAPACAVAPGAVLRARLREGASPEAVAFAAPEVIVGSRATPASDAYALAALAYFSLTGSAPLGQLSIDTSPGPLTELWTALGAALRDAPEARPTAAVLAGALDRAVHRVEYSGAIVTSPKRAVGAEPAAASPNAPASPVLVALMVFGGLVAAVGSVQLVLKSWDVLGQAGHVAILLALSALSAAGSALCARKNIASGASVGRAASLLFASVAAAYSFYLVGDRGKLALALALAPASWVGGSVSERRGFSLGSFVGKTSAGLFAMVAAGYALYLLDDVGRLLLWVGLSGAVLAAGLLRSRAMAPRAGDALLAFGTQLLWGAGAQAVVLLSVERVSGPVAAVSALVFAVTWVLALVRRSSLLGWLAAVDLAVCAVALGARLGSGSALGPPLYAAAVAAVFAAMTAAALVLRAPKPAAPFALGASLAGLISAFAALAVINERWEAHALFCAVWPYVVACAAGGLAARESSVRSFAAVTAALILLFAPTAAAFLRPELFFTALSVAVGLAVLTATLGVPALRGARGPRVEGLLLGLFSVACATDLRLLVAVVGGAGFWNESAPRSYWWTLGAASGALLALSYAFAPRVERTRYRPLELVALVPSLGLLTLQCLIDGGQSGFTPLTLALAAVLAALGAASRHAVPLVVASVALLVNLWVVYFQRLHQVFPRAVLMIGFGVGLLLIGVLYEQLVRRRLPQLRAWR